MTTWPKVPLGEILRQRRQFILIDDGTSYKRCRVQLHAQGVVQRDIVSGIEIKTKKQQPCRANDFLVAEIDAKVGGYGIVPAELDGAIVSSHYFLFEVDENRLNRSYLSYYTKTRDFHDQVVAKGSTNYAAIRPSDVLSYFIFLPPLSEQCRIVAKLNAISNNIHETFSLLKSASEEAEALCRNILLGDTAAETVSMADLVRFRPPDINVQQDETYHFAGVYSFGRGVFRGLVKAGSEFSYRKLTRLRTGNFVYPKLMAWEGALGVVPPACDGLVVSTEFPVFEVRTDRVLPEVLDTYFKMPSIWPALSGASTGTNVRRRRLNPKEFLAYRFPLPSPQTQARFRTIRKKVDHLQQLQAQAEAELAALLPAVLDRAFKGIL